MQAVILAGGLGKRLAPLTQSLPKPLVHIYNKPILKWQIEWLSSFGIRDYILTTGHLKEKIAEYAVKLTEELGVNILLSEENEPLGTAGALKNAQKLVEGDQFLMLNGDIITNVDISKVAYMKGNELVKMVLVPFRSPFGIVETVGETVTAFKEKPLIKDHWINGGIYSMKREIFDYVPEKGDLEKTTFVKLVAERRVAGVKIEDAYWHSIDSIKDAEEVSKALEAGELNKKG
ncbi:MAG: nucleotidyltransferase family protein [Candidatus Micrarchaeia archaeon]